MEDLLEYTETRLKILGNCTDPDDAVKYVHALIFSHNPPSMILAQYQVLGMALAFSEVRHIIQRSLGEAAPNNK